MSKSKKSKSAAELVAKLERKARKQAKKAKKRDAERLTRLARVEHMIDALNDPERKFPPTEVEVLSEDTRRIEAEVEAEIGRWNKEMREAADAVPIVSSKVLSTAPAASKTVQPIGRGYPEDKYRHDTTLSQAFDEGFDAGYTLALRQMEPKPSFAGLATESDN